MIQLCRKRFVFDYEDFNQKCLFSAMVVKNAVIILQHIVNTVECHLVLTSATFHVSFLSQC